MVDGVGSDCAEKLGLIVSTPRVRAGPQTGPDLFDMAEEDATRRLAGVQRQA
jgi:hypothetical protein